MPPEEEEGANYNTEGEASQIAQQITHSDVQSFAMTAGRQGVTGGDDEHSSLNRSISALGDDQTETQTETIMRRLQSLPHNQRQFVKDMRNLQRTKPPAPAAPAAQQVVRSNRPLPKPPAPKVSPQQQLMNEATGALHRQHGENVQQLNDIMSNKPSAPDGQFALHDDKYRLEQADSKHRMGDVLLEFYKIYEKSAMVLPFFTWIDSMSYFEVCRMLNTHKKESLEFIGMTPTEADQKAHAFVRNNAPAFMRGVKYLDEVARGTYTVSVKSNCLFWRAKLLDTEKLKMETVFSGMGWAMWVLSPDNVLYTNSHRRGLSHHSSFLSGENVKGAGEWTVLGGRIQYITGKSGHYKCDIPSLRESLGGMSSNSVPLDGAQVIVWSHATGEPKAIPVDEFISDKSIDASYKVIGQKAFVPVQQKKPASSRIGAIGGHRVKATEV